LNDPLDTAGFHHHDPAVLADPWPLYERMRQHCPVAHSDRYGGFWILSRYADIRAAARDPEVFSSARGVVIPSIPSPVPLIPFEVDPPLHAEYRRLELRRLAPAAVARLEPMVREVARGLIDTIHQRGEGDLVVDFALPYTSTIFCRLMGVPDADRPPIVAWTGQILERASSPERAQEAVTAFYAFLDTFLALRRAVPADDLATEFLAARIEGRPLTADELRSICFTLLVAALETTILALGTSLRAIAEQPSLRRQLIERPELIPGAVEEFLRLDGPVQGHVRTLTRDVCLHGETLRSGDKVLLLWASANRDPASFANPDTFWAGRHPNRHFSFGVGPHRCVGAPLAQLELVVAVREILATMPGYTPAAVPEVYPTARGVRRLPVQTAPDLR
jgi:cytochrome P450